MVKRVRLASSLEQKWRQFFENPCVWWDCRARAEHGSPDFKHAFTGEGLWIASHSPDWVHLRLKLLLVQPVDGTVQRVQLGTRDLIRSCLLFELKSCRDLQRGKVVHEVASQTGHDTDASVASTLISMYSRCGSLPDARRIFDEMKSRSVVSWNALMTGYADAGEGFAALELFARMVVEGCLPDDRSFVAALKACISTAENEVVKQIEGKLVKLRALAKGMAIHAQATLFGCDGSIFVSSILVDLYAKCGRMLYARQVFDRMQQQDVVSWTALISGYADNGEAEMALRMLARMRADGFAPNAITFVAALRACGNIAALEVGRRLHLEICSCGLQGLVMVANSLVGFYGKCGSMDAAQEVFDALPIKSPITWTALMTGYSRLGDAESVFRLFEEMQELKVVPDSVTFLCILNACSHAGLVDKGEEYFGGMSMKYGIHPDIEHYHCLMNVFARANELNKAVALVESMPYEPNAITWTTVLGACRKWKNVELGRLAFESLLKLGEEDVATYLLMASIYGSVGMWDEHSKMVQTLRTTSPARKKPGQSWWTDQAGRVHSFTCGGRSHPQIQQLHAKLRTVLVDMKEHGYVPDVESVASSSFMSHDEKQDALCGHSERLAIACALINTSPGTTIRIIKNLRVCEDCHRATAIISRTEKRTIICRDERRFHVFQDGVCSCGDFW